MPDLNDELREPPLPLGHRSYRPEIVSRYTGYSVHLIYRACARGEIRHVRLGRAITIPGTEVLRLTGSVS